MSLSPMRSSSIASFSWVISKILNYKAIQVGNTIIPINNITNVLEITEPVYPKELNPTEPATNCSNDIRYEWVP